eukprot:Partr_v1_DN24767_c0_g1_i1_m37158 putative coiled-coil domain containing 174
MWKPTKAIKLNAASMLDLKSEVIKKRDLIDSMDSNTKVMKKRTVVGGVSVGRGKLKLKSDSLLQAPEIVKDDEDGGDGESAKSRMKRDEILERKSRVYEALSSGRGLDTALANSDDVLVDFEQKYAQEHGNDLVQITDEFGRVRSVPRREARHVLGVAANLEDDYKEYHESQTRGYHMFPPVAMEYARQRIDAQRAVEEKVVREEQAEDEWQELLLKAGHQPKFDRFDASKDLREMGVGFYQFSQDDQVRQEQMEDLSRLREETETHRNKLELLKQKRRDRHKDRLAKINAQKVTANDDTIVEEPQKQAEDF